MADTTIEVGDITFGREEVVVMAGPCAVESEEQVMAQLPPVAASVGRRVGTGLQRVSV